jgi:predicted nucleic acid-binding protein
VGQMVSETDYFDSSALVKRYMAESGSAWVQARCNDPSRTIATVELSRVEIAAAFAGKLRGKFITHAEYQEARAKLTADVQKRYQLLPATSQRVDEAIELTARHRLRGYDAVHLACALRLNRVLLENDLPPLTLVAADNDLLKAAQDEGLEIENPNLHP